MCYGRLAAASSHDEFCFISFFALKSDGQKDSTASSPIVSALRAASPIYTLTMVSLFGWLLRHLMPQEPSKFEAPSPSLFSFFCVSIRHPKQWANILPHAFRPFASPLQSSPPRRHHRSVGCRVSLLNGGHLRQVLRPHSIRRWAPFWRPKQMHRRQRARARAPGASTRLMRRRGAAIKVHGGCRHGEGGQSRWW